MARRSGRERPLTPTLSPGGRGGRNGRALDPTLFPGGRGGRSGRAVVAVALLAALVLAACGGVEWRGTLRDTVEPAPDFILLDQHGRPFRLGDQRGQVVLLFFGYTQCPDVCPTTLATWKQVEEALGEDAGRVRFVFVTVDAERDTQERLAAHVSAFSPNFLGLRGTDAELEAVYQDYGVVHEKEEAPGSAAGYTISHSASIQVIDADGRWRERFTFGTPAEDMVHDIKLLLP